MVLCVRMFVEATLRKHVKDMMLNIVAIAADPGLRALQKQVSSYNMRSFVHVCVCIDPPGNCVYRLCISVQL